MNDPDRQAMAQARVARLSRLEGLIEIVAAALADYVGDAAHPVGNTNVTVGAKLLARHVAETLDAGGFLAARLPTAEDARALNAEVRAETERMFSRD